MGGWKRGAQAAFTTHKKATIEPGIKESMKKPLTKLKLNVRVLLERQQKKSKVNQRPKTQTSRETGGRRGKGH